MTVCIATLCEDRRAIVLAADRMISTSSFENEFAISKITRVHRSWWAMMAGNDISPVFPIIDSLGVLLSQSESEGVLRLASVVDALQLAFRTERQRRAETAVLSPYGITLREFVDHGKVALGDTIFERLLSQIQWQALGCALLVAGFDETGLGHILSVSDPGRVDRHDLPGFFAIGTGSLNALAMLYFRQQDHTDPLWQSLYHANEAKIFAAYAPGVGEWDTELIVLRSAQEPQHLTESQIDKIDQLWILEGRPRLPKRLKSRLSRVLKARSSTADTAGAAE